MPVRPTDRPLQGRRAFVTGGATRAESVRNALVEVPEEALVILVHDAARPLVDDAVIERLLGRLDGTVEGVVPGIEVQDTVKRVERGVVTETVAREGLVAVQTPQAFRAGVLRRAHAHGDEATDDAALVERLGGTVVVIPGPARNVKITHPHDLDAAAQHLAGS